MPPAHDRRPRLSVSCDGVRVRSGWARRCSAWPTCTASSCRSCSSGSASAGRRCALPLVVLVALVVPPCQPVRAGGGRAGGRKRGTRVLTAAGRAAGWKKGTRVLTAGGRAGAGAGRFRAATREPRGRVDAQLVRADGHHEGVRLCRAPQAPESVQAVRSAPPRSFLARCTAAAPSAASRAPFASRSLPLSPQPAPPAPPLRSHRSVPLAL
jgi:hypothetical protein